jgi:hypothetical protein
MRELRQLADDTKSVEETLDDLTNRLNNNVVNLQKMSQCLSLLSDSVIQSQQQMADFLAVQDSKVLSKEETVWLSALHAYLASSAKVTRSEAERVADTTLESFRQRFGR